MSPRAPSASPPRTGRRRRPLLSAYTALDTIVVRGLASARFEAMDRVADGSRPLDSSDADRLRRQGRELVA